MRNLWPRRLVDGSTEVKHGRYIHHFHIEISIITKCLKIPGGGGGGGYQSLDYGFRQNPSTGKCHLTPPTIPMGCGRKILEDLHIMMATFAGIMILQVLVGLAAACFAGYSFFYWLEKEVIVIPEDEVSNLIILEPESSTSTNVSGGKYLNAGSGAPYLGPPPDDRYIRASQMGSRSRGSSYLGEGSGTGSGSNRTHRTAESIPTGVYPNLQASIPSSSRKSGGSGGGGSSGAPPGSSMPLPSGMVPPGSSYPPGVVPTGTIPPGYPGKNRLSLRSLYKGMTSKIAFTKPFIKSFGMHLREF